MMQQQLRHVTPESLGIPSTAIEAFLDALETSGTEMHGLMIMRHGAVAAEGWWAPFAKGIRHGCQSLTKTYTATAIGLLYDEGLVKPTDKVCELLPDYMPEEMSDYLREMTLRDLLCMGTGMEKPSSRYSDDWLHTFFKTPIVHKPGTAFHYDGVITCVLGAIVREKTGLGLLDYLKPRLFDKIGINAANLKWSLLKDGLEDGGGGLYSTTEDNLRLMQLYIQKGVWNGERILSEDWISQATAKQIDNASENGIPDCKLGYCFQMWVCRPEGVFRADGAYGQYSIAIPQLDMVVSISEMASTGVFTQKTLDIVYDVLLPRVGEPLPEDPAAQAALQKRLGSLLLEKPVCAPSSPLAGKISGVVFGLEPNALGILPDTFNFLMNRKPAGIESVSLSFSGHRCTFGFESEGMRQELDAGIDGMARISESIQMAVPSNTILASGAWTREDLFTLRLRYIETCFVTEYTFEFVGDGLLLTVMPNSGTPGSGSGGPKRVAGHRL